MATYFVIADVHSFFNEMIEALNKAGYDRDNKNHVLICLGDLFDRGPDSVKCLQYINSIPNDRKVCIRGNHEDLLEDIFKREYFEYHDYHNKTHQTVYQLSGVEDYEENDDTLAIVKCREESKELREYLDSCIDYFETDKYVFVHGWIPRDEDWRNGNWKQARWYCCFDLWNEGIVVPDKTIVAGHWHTSYGHSKYHNKGTEFNDEYTLLWNLVHPEEKIGGTACFGIFEDKGIIAIDSCVSYSKKVNCLKIGKQKPLDYWRKKNESC